MVTRPMITAAAEIFPVVWTALYALMRIGAVMAMNRWVNSNDLLVLWMPLLFCLLQYLLRFDSWACLYSFVGLICLFP